MVDVGDDAKVPDSGLKAYDSAWQSSATMLPISAGVPRRRMGVHPRLCQSPIALCTASGSELRTLSSVQPGLTEFTVMPRWARATAKYRTNVSRAALAAPIATHGCKPPVRPPGA